MIRDPSDGSSKEITPYANDINRLTLKSTPEGIMTGPNPVIPVSGLRAPSQKPAVQARLERSREWLKAYFERKGQR